MAKSIHVSHLGIKHPFRICILLLAATTLTSCRVGPNYRRADVEIPDQWRWKSAAPADHVPKGEWWKVFQDSRLDELQQTAAAGNQDLRAALARVEQARAVARIDRADLFPTLRSEPAFSRYRTSGNAPSPVGFPVASFTAQEWRVPFDLSYEVDLWGKVRRGFESSRNLALGAEAARENVLLSLQADVAATYFSLVGFKAQVATLEQTIDLRQEALQVFQQRFDAGVGAEFEVERTKVELSTARADLSAAQQRKAELENALAVLCGKPAPAFSVSAVEMLAEAPEIAADLPSTLLERRPDVAEAERQLAARNAQIGVAQGAYFPALRLTANGGVQSGELRDLFTWESRVWGFSPSLSVPLFEGGRLRAETQRAHAAYDEAVAVYRQRVLVAFREVDDSLAAIYFLKEQRTAREQAVAASRNSARMAYQRFTAGTVNFLEVVDAESSRLQTELARVRAATDQLNATVRLIKALGGGWQESPEL